MKGMRFWTTLALASAMGVTLTTRAIEAQMSHGDHSAQGMAGMGMADSPATEAYRAANAAMHAGMEITYTGDPDIDFLRGMIAHHRGAVDMARIVLEHGKDPEIRKLAEGIVAAQEAEIAFMQDWLARHGGN